MPQPTPLPPDTLRRRCDPATIPFDTTATAEPLAEPVGQERAVDAVRLATRLRSPGCNLYAAGPAETGKLTLVRTFLERCAATEPTPPDVCYVFDFAAPHRPRALLLPAGRGQALRQDLERLVDDLRAEIPAALESDDLRARKEAIEEEVKARHSRAFEEVRAAAEARGIAFLRTPLGFGIAPSRNGEVLTPEQLAELSPEDHKRIQEDIAALEKQLSSAVAKSAAWAREARDKVKALLREVLGRAVAGLIDATKSRHADLAEVCGHLEAIRRDVVENVEEFLHPREQQLPAFLGGGDRSGLPGAPFRRYLANVLVDHGGRRGAPVVHELHPTLVNLLGRVEYESHLGTLVTDFHLVRAGALHRANGGYLVLDARDLLLQPYAWDALRRALRSRELRIESFGQAIGLVTTVSLEPAPVPLDVKVVLVGDRVLHRILEAVDPEFGTLFQVVADFSDDFARTPENERLFARLAAEVARGHSLRPLDRGAVARAIEESSRACGDSGRLSTHVGSLLTLLREADHWAAVAGRTTVLADDVRRAVAEADRRAGRVRDEVLERIRERSILLDTSGARVGQVNALSVVDLGRSAFGRPSRVTARVRLGKGEVVDVEREVELGGPIHSKGVMILAAFLGSRYSTSHPLSVTASLVFEQSYGPVEGDSASCAELCALLSALADLPLAQNLAVTGSVDQHGNVQPVGGVNEKVEGFFDACSVLGLTGDQGVVLPASNARHLMLRDDVVESARAGRFRVVVVRDVDQAMEALTGIPAGARGADGRFPECSVNARVEARLAALAERRAELARAGPTGTAP